MAAQLHEAPGGKLLLSLFDKDLTALAAAINTVIQQQQNHLLQTRRAQRQWENELVHISHDLRTPLTSVIGYLQLLQSAAPEEYRAEYTRIAWQKAVMLSGLVQSFFDLAYTASAYRAPHLHPIPLASGIEDSLLGFVAEFEAKGVSPCIKITDEAAFVLADAEMLDRVWHNIISNSLVHGEGALTISIVKNTVRFENKAAQNAPTSGEDVFDRFYTAGPQKKQGAGIGLAVVKALVEKMNGTVSAEWTDGRFILTVRLQSGGLPMPDASSRETPV